jgi:hypothetical protein
MSCTCQWSDRRERSACSQCIKMRLHNASVIITHPHGKACWVTQRCCMIHGSPTTVCSMEGSRVRESSICCIMRPRDPQGQQMRDRLGIRKSAPPSLPAGEAATTWPVQIANYKPYAVLEEALGCGGTSFASPSKPPLQQQLLPDAGQRFSMARLFPCRPPTVFSPIKSHAAEKQRTKIKEGRGSKKRARRRLAEDSDDSDVSLCVSGVPLPD